VFLITVLLLVLINGFSPLWHAGWSFTNRYMVGLFAIYVIGLSSFLELKNKYYVILPIIFTSYSVVLFFNWLLTTADGQYGSVIDIFYSWKNGYSPNFGPVKIGVFMKRLFLACRYKYVVNFFIK
ncbi:MAG: hypothetical protein WCQ53_03315, partial [bacterium]